MKRSNNVRAQQDTVAAQIGDRDRRLREQWLAEQAARNQSTQIGSPSAFGLRHPFAYDIPITSGFGWRATPPGTIDFLGTGGYMHTGIDFGAPCGTPVYAAAAGTVTVGGWTTGGGGWTVMISHGVGQGNALTTYVESSPRDSKTKDGARGLMKSSRPSNTHLKHP